MNAEDLRVRLSDEALETLAAAETDEEIRQAFSLMVGDIAEAYGARWRDVAEAAPVIAGRASSLCADLAHREQEAAHAKRRHLPRSHALHAGGPGARAFAAAELAESGLWPHPAAAPHARTVRRTTRAERKDILDGRLPSLALAIAADEALDAAIEEYAELMEELSGPPGHRSAHLVGAWDRRFKEVVLPRFSRNTRVAGFAKDGANVHSCVAAIAARGRMLQNASGISAEMTMLAGSFALRPARRRRENSHDQFARKLGAAVLGSAFGFTHGWSRSPRAEYRHAPYVTAHEDGYDPCDDDQEVTVVVDGAIPLGFTRAELARLSVLAVPAAVSRLREEAADPRKEEHDRLRFALISDAADAAAFGMRAEIVSFARLIGLPEAAPETAAPYAGTRLHDAAPVGSRPPVLRCRVRGKELRCRAVADDHGRLVGYRAYDVLSEELHGEPLHAVFDLDGRRIGYLEDGRFKAGEPRQHFISAPERIEI